MSGSGPLPLWSQIAHVRTTLPEPGRVDLYAVRPAGRGDAAVILEAYDAGGGLLVAGAMPVWEINQALAAVMATDGSQARRLAVRDERRGHGGWVDVVCDGTLVNVGVTGDAGTVEFRTSRAAFTADLQALLRHYLRLARTVDSSRVVVLPDVVPTVALPG